MPEIHDTDSKRFCPVEDITEFLAERVNSSTLVETGGDPETKQRNARLLIFEDDEHGRWSVGPQMGRTQVFDSSRNDVSWDSPTGNHNWTSDTLRRFQLMADEGDAGFDETGIVAAGCAFPGGSVGVEWLTEREMKEYPGVFPDVAEHETFPSIGDAIESYDGDAALRVEWTDRASIPPSRLHE